MIENQRKTLQDYLEEGGIKGKFFKHIGRDPAQEIYRVIGFDRDYRTEPRLMIKVTYLEEPNKDSELPLIAHLYDYEVTPEELKRAQRNGLANVLAQKAQTNDSPQASMDPYNPLSS